MTEHQYKTLGAFLGQPNVAQHLASAEELKAAYERIATLENTLNECRSYFEGASDVIDGSYGQPAPNREMSLLIEIDEVLSWQAIEQK